jgi:two-component system, NtrC family, response regulator AtoC
VSQNRRILIVDDEAVMTGFLGDLLSRNFQVDSAPSAEEAAALIGSQNYDLVFTDMQMEHRESGLDVLSYCRRTRPDLPVVLMTAYGTVDNAVEAMKMGAREILTKPFGPGELFSLIERILEERVEEAQHKTRNNDAVTRSPKNKERHNIVGESKSLQRIFTIVENVAQTNATVLLTGESGTGKELVAALIHASSRRSSAPFIKINCAAITDTLLESTLFGHEKGAFTGAIKRTPGKFELANGGSLLLDEISEMKPELQSKLLRVLQEREFERVGGITTIPTDVRIIATSNRNLKEEVRKGHFREDLYFRLNVVPLHIPPLRERDGDVPLLLNYFLDRYSEEHGLERPELEPGLLESLQRMPWPGNVRQFQNAVERAMVLGRNCRIGMRDFLLDYDLGERQEKKDLFDEDLTIKEMEKKMILAALGRFQDNRTQAARHLGISVRTLRNKLNQYRGDHEAVGA